MINLSIISACNNNCSYCFQADDYHKKPYILEFDEILNIFEWSKGASRMAILGGEASLHPECLRICKASSLRFPTSFFTNLLFDRKLLQELIKLNMVWLVNTNTNKDLVPLFQDNMEYLGKVNPELLIGFGITLTSNLKQDEKCIENLVQIAKKYPHVVKWLRIALATPYGEKKFKLVNFDKSMMRFYSMIEKEKLSHPVLFDCSVNYCQLSHQVMSKIKNDPRTHYVSNSCEGVKIDILANRRINFCGSTPIELFSELNDYRMFKNWYECGNYIGNFVNEYMKKYNFICKNSTICKSKECQGTCFAICANLVKEEMKKPDIIRNFHKIRRDFLGQ